ncbi:hypothetical protein HZA40_01875 [Candidatus Peregrinibacteria bacterium]|nr:hypothetical protein [Candidatus Peregrinibacteria bacterium]
MKKEDESSSKIKKLLTSRNVLIGIIFALLLFQYIKFNGILGDFSFMQGKSTSLVSEVGELKDSYKKIGDDLSEIRNFLRMPEHNYTNFSSDKNTAKSDDENENKLQLALFSYIDYLSIQGKKDSSVKSAQSVLEDLAQNQQFFKILANNDLISSLNNSADAVSLKITDQNGNDILTFYLDKNEGKLFRKTPNSKEEISADDSEKFKTELFSFLDKNSGDLKTAAKNIKSKKSEIEKSINSAEAQKKANETHANLNSSPSEKDLKITYSILNKSQEPVGEIVLDMKTLDITLVDKNDNSAVIKTSDISKELVPFLSKLDAKTFIGKKVEKTLSDLKNILSDKGFKSLMSKARLNISDSPREDDDRFYYDISNSQGNKLSSIVIEKATGTVNILKPDGTTLQNLLFFGKDSKKKL